MIWSYTVKSLFMPSFNPLTGLVITQVRVDSAPVPEIVGTAILNTPGILTRSHPW